MIFAIFCTDRLGAGELRRRTRPAHRDWLHSPHAKVKLLMSGATLEPDAKTMNGSLMIVSAESLVNVEAFTAQDPYRLAGLFEHWEIRPWDWTFGNPAGTPSINPTQPGDSHAQPQ